MRRGSAQWVIWEWETLIAWISWVQQASLTVIPLVSVCECKCQNAVQPWGSLPGVCSDECFMSAWMERTVMRHMGKTDWTEDVHLTHKTQRLLRLERKRTIQIIFSCKVDDTLTKEQRVLKEAWGGLCVCVCVSPSEWVFSDHTEQKIHKETFEGFFVLICIHTSSITMLNSLFVRFLATLMNRAVRAERSPVVGFFFSFFFFFERSVI